MHVFPAGDEELKETFLHFWKYKSPFWAEAFLDYG
jgi:hypothetical protein